jgi:2-(3-amino-3-carboxypropyl)histidine synthase
MFKLELDKIVDEIKKREAKQVLVQLPDGLKMRTAEIVDAIEAKTGAMCFIWFSSCFGACDIPLGLAPLKIDLMIQWGHNRYHKTNEEW